MQALATALGSTIGTGSIAGVATAIFFGGPGAVFWIWVSAFLGMMIGFAEKTLAVQYRRKDSAGRWIGGPMYYMRDGLGWKKTAAFFSVICVASTLLGGNVVQSNSIANALQSGFHWNPKITGTAVMLLTAMIMLGGLKRIAAASELLVPLMGAVFLIGGFIVILYHRESLPAILSEIWLEAFRPQSAAGGCAGYGIIAAMRYGVARGVFTNEAGVGSSAIAHASSVTGEPAQQGIWGIFEVFVATLLICSVTALAILTSGVYNQTAALTAIASGDLSGQLIGAPLSMAAFSTVMGKWGTVLVAVSLLLFAFTSILGWSFYGEQALGYLTQSKLVCWGYRILFLCAIVWGSVCDVGEIWLIADICTGLMALPNLLALWHLLPQSLEQLEHWRKNHEKKLGAHTRR